MDPTTGPPSVHLPFPFPFGGLRERTASVSSNGWISFGSPAWGQLGKVSEDDRGAAAVTGDFERAIMPYWGDLEGAQGMKMVAPAGGHSVAFQWEASQDGGGPRRSFQLVLFRDGRFRFDYPGRNEPGGHKAFIGYSLGTGAAASTRSRPIRGRSSPKASSSHRARCKRPRPCRRDARCSTCPETPLRACAHAAGKSWN